MKQVIVKPFDYTMIVIVGEEELEEFRKTSSLDKETLSTAGNAGYVLDITDSNGVDYSFVYLMEDVEEYVIWHEALHVVHFMMDKRGIPINVENTEVQTYSQAQIVGILKEAIDDKIKKDVRKILGKKKRKTKKK